MKRLFNGLQNRREFLRSFMRNSVLTTFGVFGGTMLLRKHDDSEQHICINEYLCNGCRILPTCILPQGQSARQAKVDRMAGNAL